MLNFLRPRETPRVIFSIVAAIGVRLLIAVANGTGGRPFRAYPGMSHSIVLMLVLS
jgi:hypothetical protein